MKNRVLMAALVLVASVGFSFQTSAQNNPLSSWNDTAAKQVIVDFVGRVTKIDGPDFVAPADRIATFDNDGTLWAEQPVVQLAFVISRLKAVVDKHPELKNDPTVRAGLKGDHAYLVAAGEGAVMKLLAVTSSGMTQHEFNADVKAFFATAKHPKFGVSFQNTAYLPMVELLQYLRDNGFQTWICSGGGSDFMRQISMEAYGIRPEQVIGSNGVKQWKMGSDGKGELHRLPKILTINDKAGKPLGIVMQIGRPPLLAAGNERTGGDIAHLEYSQSRKGPSLQLIINHDDAEREFQYSELDNASLNAAKKNGWTVVSIKHDWNKVFSFQPRVAN